MKYIILLASLLLIHFFSSAQQTFVSKGKIEFEKKENVFKAVDMMISDWGDDDAEKEIWQERIKKGMKQFAVTYFDLYFTETKSLFKPGREVPGEKGDSWFQSPASENVVCTDLSNGNYTSQKNIFGSMFLIQDSARKVEWRITDETRDIAGFTCRKAVGKMLDSIYVVAFYTDQILATGGPESFHGLPGMILGLAIPRLNTTWFATKLEVTPLTDAGLAAPTKGKKQTEASFTKTLQDLMKDWGKSSKRRLIQAVI